MLFFEDHLLYLKNMRALKAKEFHSRQEEVWGRELYDYFLNGLEEKDRRILIERNIFNFQVAISTLGRD